jgi:vesicle-associated membrane protein 7
LRNLDKAIDMGERTEILVQKTQVMADTSYDLSKTAKAVERKMWWKNKKVCLALILLVIVAVVVIAAIAGAFWYAYMPIIKTS